MKYRWEWQVTCGLCGFKSRFYRFHNIARVRAIFHAIHRHIFGHTKIAARRPDHPKYLVST